MIRNKEDFIFGTHAVIEAIESGQSCQKILLRKGLRSELSKELIDLLKKHNIPIQIVPEEKLNRITRKNHQGVIAFMSPVAFQNVQDVVIGLFETGKEPFIIVLDEITDVRNFGAIVRTAECAGVDAIVIPDKGSARIGADVVKTSAGAIYNVPICRTFDMKKSLLYLKDSGLTLIAATEKADQSVFNTELKGPVALLMGAEDTGISQWLLGLADVKLSIPIYGKIESLNVSVATSIIIYEIIRQRNLK